MDPETLAKLAAFFPSPWDVDSFPHVSPQYSSAAIYAADSSRVATLRGEHSQALAELIVQAVNREFAILQN